jgi:pimeloyl-ACP methyl ester carboxylesterase
MIAFTRALPEHPIPDAALRQISTPTLVSHGDRDRFFDVRHAVDLFRVIPDARLWVIPDLDHPIQGVDVSSVAPQIGSFLLGR